MFAVAKMYPAVCALEVLTLRPGNSIRSVLVAEKHHEKEAYASRIGLQRTPT